MANDNSSDERKEDISSSDETEEDNSNSDERKEDISSDESEEDNSSKEGEEGIKKGRKKRSKIAKEEETLQVLLKKMKKEDGESSSPPPQIEIRVWIPDYRNIVLSEYGRCIYKQLTESDVNAGKNRLMLGKQEVKDHFLSRLKKIEIPGVEGVDVVVYGPNGQPHEMKFKIWIKNTPVFTNGWIEFVETYRLMKYCDVLRIWMFKAWKDGKICFVIDSIRFKRITKQLSKKILEHCSFPRLRIIP